MSDNVQFDTDQEQVVIGNRSSPNFAYRGGEGQSQVPGMAAWLMRKGIIKNESVAKSALVIIVIMNFIIAAAVLYFFALR